MTHHNKMLRYLRDLFSTEGMPAVVMTNNGPPFNGEEFKHFAREFDFTHQTSSPYFHQSNGFIEAMVKKVKTAYKKTDGSPKCSSPSTATAMGHTTSVRLAISCRDFAWKAHTRSCHAPSSQTHQHTVNMLTTTRNTEHSKGTVRSSSQSQGQMSPQSERTCMVLSKQAVWHETKVVDRDSERNFGMRMLVHHRRPKREAIQEKQSSLEANMS